MLILTQTRLAERENRSGFTFPDASEQLKFTGIANWKSIGDLIASTLEQSAWKRKIDQISREREKKRKRRNSFHLFFFWKYLIKLRGGGINRNRYFFHFTNHLDNNIALDRLTGWGSLPWSHQAGGSLSLWRLAPGEWGRSHSLGQTGWTKEE
jgi:hypothetical protein